MLTHWLEVGGTNTTGGFIVWGHCLERWSTTQPVVALSPGEAELYGILRAGGQGIGAQNMLRDLGLLLST